MASGHGVKKDRKEENENRRVPESRFKPITGHSGPLGTKTGWVPPNDLGTSVSTWQDEQGHYGEVESQASFGLGYGRSGVDFSSHVVGPLRTQNRAERAAQSLANRVETGGDVDQYSARSYTEYYNRGR